MQHWRLARTLLLLSVAGGACSAPDNAGVAMPIGRLPAVGAPATQSFQVLHTFEDDRDGSRPEAPLVFVDGTAYGTTLAGGIRKYGKAVYDPAGTIYKITAAGKYSVVYRFTVHIPFGQRAYPDGGLVSDSAGNFYGTTNEGGPMHLGTVYKRNANGRVTTLHTFTGGSDGEFPYAGLLRDARGNLYGTTEAGGNDRCYGAGCGTVFKIDAQRHESVVYAFTGNPSDGCVPYGGVVRDRHGNLYGTTAQCAGCPMDYLCGTAYKVNPHGVETVLYKFTTTAGGLGPFDTLLLASDGYLYGTTAGGGAGYDGVIFKMDTHGNETVLHNFRGGGDGSGPFGGLIQDKGGNLYGTTEFGGGGKCADRNGCGTVFEFSNAGQETVLYRFTGKQDGEGPMAGLAMDAAGFLYGTTPDGGDTACDNGVGCGVVFTLKP